MDELENSNTFPKLEQSKRPQLQRQSNIENNLKEDMVNIVQNSSTITDQANEQMNKSKSAFILVNSQNSSIFFNNTNVDQEGETINNPNVNNFNNNSPIASNSSVTKSPSVKSATYSSTSSASSSSVFLLNNTNSNNTNTIGTRTNENIVNGQEYE